MASALPEQRLTFDEIFAARSRNTMTSRFGRLMDALDKSASDDECSSNESADEGYEGAGDDTNGPSTVEVSASAPEDVRLEQEQASFLEKWENQALTMPSATSRNKEHVRGRWRDQSQNESIQIVKQIEQMG